MVTKRIIALINLEEQTYRTDLHIDSFETKK